MWGRKRNITYPGEKAGVGGIVFVGRGRDRKLKNSSGELRGGEGNHRLKKKA